MHRDVWNAPNPKNVARPLAWFVFDAAPHRDAPIELRRISRRA